MSPSPPPDPAAGKSRPESSPTSPEFFIVGIGASAGGLEAISELLKPLPAHVGLTLVIAQHLDREHQSLLVELLGPVSALPVAWAAHGEALRAGHVYVVPAGNSLRLEQGVMLLRPSPPKSTSRIDDFFHSLAEECRDRAIGVILSGNGSDGVAGLRAIKTAGGFGFAQDPATAAFPSLPRAAIDSGAVDRVLAPGSIAGELMRLSQMSRAMWDMIEVPPHPPAKSLETEQLATIFRLLAARTGVDFSEYKQTTIKRRLVRRMVLVKADDLTSYVKLLQKNREELDQLYESLLINVTEFFREPEYFEFLQQEVFPGMIRAHADGSPLRIWVPGCSTGEEAYSIAMLLRELLEQHGPLTQVQIFGTDISDRAIGIARAGLYTTAEVAGISPERLRRFFHKTERGFVVQKPIRDMCVFARQNVIKDSPFSRLDLVSCRNLLIYLSPALQRRLMPIFHSALNPSGILVLGSSESIGSHAELFRLIDRRFRIYERKSTRHRANFEFALDHVRVDARPPSVPASAMAAPHPEPFDVIREADRILLSRLGPAGVIVNEDLEIQQFRGDVTPFLAPSEGRASLNLLKMAREGLAGELQQVVQQAREGGIRVHRAGVSILQGDVAKSIDLDVTPIDNVGPRERFYLVLFSSSDPDAPLPPEPDAKIRAKKSVYLSQIDQLRQDLQATRNYLQSAIEKHEATNQELRAANEEIQSSNEELQSTNEELETAKEELQSTNEELTTVNEELHSRQLELMHVNNDLNNLINSVHLPIIILGHDMRIRRFTPMAEKVLNVIPSDVGRPLSDININLNIPNLQQLIHEVIDSLTIKEVEIQDHRGRWFSMRLRPYKTADYKIEGVVLTLLDIDQMKRTITDHEEAREVAQAVLECIPEPMAAVDGQLRLRLANERFRLLLHLPAREPVSEKPLLEALQQGGQLEEMRQALQTQLAGTDTASVEREIELEVPGSGRVRFILTARPIARGTRTYPLALLSLQRRS